MPSQRDLCNWKKMRAFASRSSFSVLAVFVVLTSFQNQFKSEALVLEEEFSGKVVTELKVNLPADEVWAVYRSKQFLKLLHKHSTGYFNTVEYITGDGGVGTLANITLQPESSGLYLINQIIVIDDKTKTRIVRNVEGLFRNSGISPFQSTTRILEKEKTSCIIRTTIAFGIKQESLSNASLIRPSWLLPTIIVDYINLMKSPPTVLRKEFSGEIASEMKVNLPVNEIWDVFSQKYFGHLLVKLLPNYFKQIDYIKGDGGVGSILNITLQPAFASLNRLEEVIQLDDRTKTGLLRHIKGGMLNSGFIEFASGYKIIKKVHNSCVIRAFTPFKIKVESVSNASTLQPDWGTAMTIAKYVNSMEM